MTSGQIFNNTRGTGEVVGAIGSGFTCGDDDCDGVVIGKVSDGIENKGVVDEDVAGERGEDEDDGRIEEEAVDNGVRRGDVAIEYRREEEHRDDGKR